MTPPADTPVAGDTPTGRDLIAAAMKEDRGPDSLAAHVTRLAKDLGIWGYHARDSRSASARGWPDWVLIGPGGILFRELKTARGRLSAEQEAVGEMLTAAGANWSAWRPADLLDGRISRELAEISALGASRRTV